MGTIPASLEALRATLLAREIRLGDRVGAGGAATVYEGTDEKHGRRVAIKVLDPIVAAAVTAERFAREVAVVASLQHPHILPLYDSGEVDGLRYYIMPLTVGESVRDRLAQIGRLPVDEAVRLGLEIADALEYAHGLGVVHRDVTPGNILLQGGHFVLADFGLAAVGHRTDHLNVDPTSPSGLTEPGSFVGTLEYMAPEQIVGGEVDGRADVYGLASVLYEALSGRLPFAGNNSAHLAQQKLLDRHDPLDQVVTGVPGALATLVDRGLAAEPAQRPRAVEFTEALRPLLGLAAGPAGRRRWRAAIRPLPIAALALALGGATLWWALTPPRLDPRRVVVAGFTNETGNRALDAFGDHVEALIAGGLAQAGHVEVITAAVDLPIRTPLAAGAPETPPERLTALARESRAGTVIAGSFFITGDRLEVSVEVTDARTGELRLAVGPLFGTVDASSRLAENVGRQVVRAVDSLFAQPPVPPSSAKRRSASTP